MPKKHPWRSSERFLTRSNRNGPVAKGAAVRPWKVYGIHQNRAVSMATAGMAAFHGTLCDAEELLLVPQRHRPFRGPDMLLCTDFATSPSQKQALVGQQGFHKEPGGLMVRSCPERALALRMAKCARRQPPSSEPHRARQHRGESAT